MVWRSHDAEVASRKADLEQSNRNKKNSAQIEKFLNAGCFFLGDGISIWEYEDQFDLRQSLHLHQLNDLDGKNFRIVKYSAGYVFAFRHGEWPADISEWTIREITGLLTDRSGQGDRILVHFARTNAAIEFAKAERIAQIAVILSRLVSRMNDLRSRTASDMGPGAAAVYVITTKARNCAKIGISDNPTKRRANLQTGNSQQLMVHATFWLEKRQHAALVEQHCHRKLKAKGHFTIGEWFSVEPETAARFVVEIYAELLEQKAIIEGIPTASEKSTDQELRLEVIARSRWGHSKRQNLIAILFGRKVTVFRKRNGWHWVCDGHFSSATYEAHEAAQQAVMEFINPGRAQMLDLLLSDS